MKHGAAAMGHLVSLETVVTSGAGVYEIPCFCGVKVRGGSHQEALASLAVHCGVSPKRSRKPKPVSPALDGVDWSEH